MIFCLFKAGFDSIAAWYLDTYERLEQAADVSDMIFYILCVGSLLGSALGLSFYNC